MTGLLRTTAMGLVIASLAVSGAYSQSKSKSPATDPQLKIEHVETGEAIEDLFDAITELREATVLLLNHKNAGPERDAAIDHAQDALTYAQRALLQLPAEYRVADAKLREAKDWPVVMARLDDASRELQDAMERLKKQPAGQARDAAIGTIRKSLGKVHEAMADLPDWTPATD